MSEMLRAAFEEVMRQDLDRRILLELLRAEREVRYEELRKAVGETSNQTFKYAIDRLSRHALLARRLVPQGKRHASHLSPTSRGVTIATVLKSLGSDLAVPPDLPAEVLVTIRQVFLGQQSRGIVQP